MKKIIALVLCLALALSLTAVSTAEGKTAYKIGICNFVDDASLNQIVENIRASLADIEQERGVTIEILYDNCNADANVMNQIIANFIADDVDLMVGVATPVAMAMQSLTEDSQTPVVFAAVSDPVGAGLVESLEAPGANVTGTSDFLDTNAVLNLIFAANPEVKKVALLYNPSEDASAAPVAAAKEILGAKGVEVKEYTGSNPSEVMLAADAIVADEMDAVFTPTDNTIMAAELSIYEKFAEAKIPHYTGADSFALNGAFLGYGVDYANLGKETANMIAAILVDGADIAATPVMTFDNGTATVNTETCALIGLDYDAVAAAFAPFCTTVQPITTAESFDELGQ
jgi:putative ABC transport system substrate-binding protein